MIKHIAAIILTLTLTHVALPKTNEIIRIKKEHYIKLTEEIPRKYEEIIEEQGRIIEESKEMIRENIGVIKRLQESERRLLEEVEKTKKSNEVLLREVERARNGVFVGVEGWGGVGFGNISLDFGAGVFGEVVWSEENIKKITGLDIQQSAKISIWKNTKEIGTSLVFSFKIKIK